MTKGFLCGLTSIAVTLTYDFNGPIIVSHIISSSLRHLTSSGNTFSSDYTFRKFTKLSIRSGYFSSLMQLSWYKDSGHIEGDAQVSDILTL